MCQDQVVIFIAQKMAAGSGLMTSVMKTLDQDRYDQIEKLAFVDNHTTAF